VKKSTLLAFTVVLAACDASGGAASESSGQAADGFTLVPNTSGLQAKIPNGAVPNAMGGASGFHSKDDAKLSIMIREVSDTEKTATFETAKESTEELLFQKWIKSDKTDDGWVFTYESDKLDGEANTVGTQFSFEVRKKVGEKLLKCYGSSDKKDALDGAVGACTSLKSA